MMRAAMLAVLMLVATLALVWFDPARPPAHIQGARTLTHAQFALGASPVPPVTGWRAITLPDSWRARRPTTTGLAWYRIPFTLDALPAASQALYLPRLAMAGELWLNGALLSPHAPLALPSGASSQGRDVPVYVVLPSSAFRVGGNLLTIRLRGDTQVRSGLSAVRLGLVERIAPVWQRQHLLQVVLPQLQVILLGAAVWLAYAYAQRRRNYLMIVVGLGLGVMSLVLDLLPPLSLSSGDRHAVRILVFTSVVWLLCRGGLHLTSVQRRGALRLLDALWVGSMLVMCVLAVLRIIDDRGWILLLPLTCVLVTVCALIVQQAWRLRSLGQALLGLSALLWTATVLHSLVLPWEWLPWDSYRYSSAGSIPCSVMLLLFFGERFVLDREEAARHQRDAVGLERARILQDMHDGMGAQLITARRLALRPEVERTELARVIDESLQDLRLIIDSLDVAQGDVLPLLGNLRFRLQPRLAALGIMMQWSVQPAPAFESLSPAGALTILRIVQESINNALQHAHPTELGVAVMAEGSDLIIRVTDNGCGFEQRRVGGAGRGLAGMRLRAEKLGAAVLIHSAPGQGTCVTLRVPLRLADSAQSETF